MITVSDQERVEISDGVEEILLHDKDVARRNHATEILVGQLNVMGLTVDMAVKELKVWHNKSVKYSNIDWFRHIWNDWDTAWTGEGDCQGRSC